MGAQIGVGFVGLAQFGVATSPMHVLVGGAGDELGVVVVQEGRLAVATAYADVGGKAGGQDAGLLVQLLRQGGATAVDVGHGLGGYEGGHAQRGSDQRALVHEESPFIVVLVR